MMLMIIHTLYSPGGAGASSGFQSTPSAGEFCLNFPTILVSSLSNLKACTLTTTINLTLFIFSLKDQPLAPSPLQPRQPLREDSALGQAVPLVPLHLVQQHQVPGDSSLDLYPKQLHLLLQSHDPKQQLQEGAQGNRSFIFSLHSS